MTAQTEKIQTLFKVLLKRDPSYDELKVWGSALDETGDFYNLFERMSSGFEFKHKSGVSCHWPAGHFYSPVVDPATVKAYVSHERERATPNSISGVKLDLEAMTDLWVSNRLWIAKTPFRKERSAPLRYSWEHSPYPIGDATTYRSVIHQLHPKRIIEIGCGYSTACALDSIDEAGISDIEITCIDPFPAALGKVLHPSDFSRIRLIESGVQTAEGADYESLQRNDILFIDSTHVLKTGSDVHHELFEILPRLNAGVLVHFHDIRWPFEYPDPFIFDKNFSWNEAYALRAFLMYNERYSVWFYNSMFAQYRSNLIRDTFPDFLINPGSSIWLRVQG